MYSSSMVDDSVKGRVGSTFQLSITIFILVGEFLNYLLIPSFDTTKCVPLTPFSWKMQLGFPAVFGICFIVTVLFGPRLKRKPASPPPA